MVEQVATQADTYLRSGSNELKILQYSVCDQTYGINILKVSRILQEMPGFRTVPDTPMAVRGVFNEHDLVIPVFDLGLFLTGTETDINDRYRVIVTEFFGLMNAFLVNSVETVHTVLWQQVMDAQGVFDTGDNPYVISIVRPTEEQMILLLDYETIILELTPGQKQTEVKRAQPVQLDGNNRKILIAEDSPSVRDMLALELEERGFQVFAAHDGKQAVEMVEQNNDIVLVITDVEMPERDGLALTKHIKESDQLKHIPVIVYSSIGDIGMKERAKYLQAEEHITKLALDELFEKIAQLLGDPKP